MSMQRFEKQNGNEGARFSINLPAVTMMAISALLFGPTTQLYANPANPMNDIEKISNPKFLPAIVLGSNIMNNTMRPFASAKILANQSLAQTAFHIASCEKQANSKTPKDSIKFINSRKSLTDISLQEGFNSKPVILNYVLCPIIEGCQPPKYSDKQFASKASPFP